MSTASCCVALKPEFWLLPPDVCTFQPCSTSCRVELSQDAFCCALGCRFEAHHRADLQVPFAYCWSEALVPKPADWGDHIDVVGYCFLNEGSHMKYHPPQELTDFLAAGEAPVYIGFGSLMVDDAKKLTGIILEAAKKTGQRVLLSR